MFDRDYLGHWDLPPGRDVTVTIARVEAGTLTSQGNRKTKKPILYFEGKEKGMAINKTNGKAIAAIYGAKTEKWIGQPIAIYATTTQFGSEVVECIRVRPTAPKRNGKAAAPEQAVAAAPAYDPDTGEVPPDEVPT
jgi:hypothetical protein